MIFSGDVVGLLLGAMVFMIPIIAILTSHQRKMAQIIHGQAHGANEAEVLQLRRDVAELKQAMAHQLIALDNLHAAQRELKNQLTSTTLDS